jgi:hypothetical protein
MTDKQPEALRLADLLENEKHVTDLALFKAAAELRRLHEVNAELFAALDYVIRDLELRSNLKLGDEKGEVDIGHGAYIKAKAAIAKATGKQYAN